MDDFNAEPPVIGVGYANEPTVIGVYATEPPVVLRVPILVVLTGVARVAVKLRFGDVLPDRCMFTPPNQTIISN